MTFSLILLFELTLIIMAFTERVKRFLTMLIAQGVLLFVIAYLQLKHINTLYLVFILTETIIMKGLFVPLFLNQMRKRNKFDRLAHSKVSTFVTVIAISAAIVSGFLLSNDNHLHAKFLSASIASIITGIYFVMIHRNIFTHLVGYLIMENGVFLFSLAVGSEMPMLVNTTILLDIFVGVLVLGIFVNRVSDMFEKMHVDDLAQLKD
ncbi:MAG: NADH-quinone oxidoreductase subunit K [Candidatus Scalindua sp.]